MPTSQLSGNRARRGRSVRDITGREYARQHAEQEAKQAAAQLDPAEVRRAAFSKGHEAGYAAGWEALSTGLHNLFKTEGIEAVREFLDELADDQGDGTEAG